MIKVSCCIASPPFHQLGSAKPFALQHYHYNIGNALCQVFFKKISFFLKMCGFGKEKYAKILKWKTLESLFKALFFICVRHNS